MWILTKIKKLTQGRLDSGASLSNLAKEVNVHDRYWNFIIIFIVDQVFVQPKKHRLNSMHKAKEVVLLLV